MKAWLKAWRATLAVRTGARDAATTSFKLGDLDMNQGLIVQDARHARTKFSKTFITVFYPVGQLALEIPLDLVGCGHGQHPRAVASFRNPGSRARPGVATGNSPERWVLR